MNRWGTDNEHLDCAAIYYWVEYTAAVLHLFIFTYHHFLWDCPGECQKYVAKLDKLAEEERLTVKPQILYILLHKN